MYDSEVLTWYGVFFFLCRINNISNDNQWFKPYAFKCHIGKPIQFFIFFFDKKEELSHKYLNSNLLLCTDNSKQWFWNGHTFLLGFCKTSYGQTFGVKIDVITVLLLFIIVLAFHFIQNRNVMLENIMMGKKFFSKKNENNSFQLVSA